MAEAQYTPLDHDVKKNEFRVRIRDAERQRKNPQEQDRGIVRSTDPRFGETAIKLKLGDNNTEAFLVKKQEILTSRDGRTYEIEKIVDAETIRQEFETWLNRAIQEEEIPITGGDEDGPLLVWTGSPSGSPATSFSNKKGHFVSGNKLNDYEPGRDVFELNRRAKIRGQEFGNILLPHILDTFEQNELQRAKYQEEEEYPQETWFRLGDISIPENFRMDETFNAKNEQTNRFHLSAEKVIEEAFDEEKLKKLLAQAQNLAPEKLPKGTAVESNEIIFQLAQSQEDQKKLTLHILIKPCW